MSGTEGDLGLAIDGSRIVKGYPIELTDLQPGSRIQISRDPYDEPMPTTGVVKRIVLEKRSGAVLTIIKYLEDKTGHTREVFWPEDPKGACLDILEARPDQSDSEHDASTHDGPAREVEASSGGTLTMDNDDFYREELARRLREFAKQRHVAEEQVVSLRVRPLQPDGSVGYVGWPSHEQAISLAEVSKVPESVPFFGAEYLPGGFKAYQPARADLLWIPHETGLEIIGLVLGVIGAIEPTVNGVKWLVNRLMGKPERDIYQPYSVATVQLEVRVLRGGQVHQEVILQRIETLVEDEKGFLHTVEERVRRVTAYRAEPGAAPDTGRI